MKAPGEKQSPMETHPADQIPFYIAGQLSAAQRAEVRKHLSECTDCRAELAFWETLAGEIRASNAAIAAPTDLVERSLGRMHARGPVRRRLLQAFGLLKAQAYLIKRELWPVSIVMMVLSVIAALLSERTGVVTFIAPLVAAASLATIYGPQNDPAGELTLATPTSPWKILLARLTLVSGYNLLLALAASLFLLPIVSADLLGTLILSWLGPFTFLSALALFLSLWVGTANAITLTYAIWIFQFIQPPGMLADWSPLLIWGNFQTAYRQFWQNPALLLSLALVLVCLALWSTRASERTFINKMAS